MLCFVPLNNLNITYINIGIIGMSDIGLDIVKFYV